MSAVQSRPSPPFFLTICQPENFPRTDFVPRFVPNSGTLQRIPAHESPDLGCHSSEDSKRGADGIGECCSGDLNVLSKLVLVPGTGDLDAVFDKFLTHTQVLGDRLG